MTLAVRLRSSDPVQRTEAIAEVAGRGRVAPEELAALIDCLGHARKAVQRPAAEALAGLAAAGQPIAPALAAALDSTSARLRWGAAFALSLVGELPAAAVPVLLETLGSDDGDLRWAAAGLLGRVTERAPLLAALRELATAGSPPQRKMALYCLRDLEARSAEVERVLHGCLEDADRDVRLAAIASLARLAIDRALAAERLRAALKGSDARVRRAAAAALGVLGEPSTAVVAALRRAGTDGDASLRRAAAGALRRLGIVPA